MNLHNLKPAKGSTKNSKRVGRGQGSINCSHEEISHKERRHRVCERR